MISYLEFEKPVAALQERIAELRAAADGDDVDISSELQRLENKSAEMLASTYASLTPWQKTQVARHPSRPHFRDYVEYLFEEFIPLGGDRHYGEDEAIMGGFATFNGRKIMLIGHEKGNDTQSRLRHNFGMGKPEGYRKAIRLMELAGRFNLPVVTLVDTSGAFPGIEAEERGQAEAIARSTEACLALPVPMVSVIVGEGGSGGAVALASAERVLMFEHAVYSVISPEGCASILWRTAEKAAQAAEAMKLTAQDLLGLGVIDRIVPEPVGGAHRDPASATAALGTAIGEELHSLSGKSPKQLQRMREDRFLAIGDQRKQGRRGR
ncbi:acetyl-CoA carboxylase carboxyl transferase subunit alpha [Altererythrobacter atlanticus]|uniref:Acetyl-coenzyme A carboxylase carboxyl transferase subunit alpha n=1 Tax=Croceibacterium atlanticum TaxID=1267766 RepID=A0A0F7KSN9_9SPHN|nr:acetyl-CoA carboxylase carboxyltransferase subunit alpha [Croceibacterium atlanticum]AKH41775.1 Acetyl-coenzyme A carboxylase carboxyl transferase subunit alpha [Croceibacterium atlanticum]MBB5733240.1 acetyl-CoA carboxylase carboxyl transferase subunit alpha [Croceibacterium atlanticum]